MKLSKPSKGVLNDMIRTIKDHLVTEIEVFENEGKNKKKRDLVLIFRLER